MNTGIICEFNPFHSGHKHLIDSVKNDGAVICVMSGNYVQRGEFAIYDKFKRCAAALENGADLVIELPCVYSLMSAEGFAKAGVTLLESTNLQKFSFYFLWRTSFTALFFGRERT